MDSYSLKSNLKTSLLCLFLISPSSFGVTSISLDNEKLPSSFNTGLNSLYQIKASKEIVLPNGKIKYKYKQLYKNIPVWGASLVKEDNAKFHGSLLMGIEQDLDKVTPKLSIDDAVKLIKNRFKDFDDDAANLNIDLYIKDVNSTAVLIYKIDFLLEKPSLSRPNMIMDANNGEILELWDGLTNIEKAQSTGPGGNEKIGRYEFGKDYDYLETTKVGKKCHMKNVNVLTFDNKHSESTMSYAKEKPFKFDCSENTYKEINGGYSPINDAHYFGNVVFQMYKDWFDVKPINSKLKLLVHYGKKFENAVWTGKEMLFGDGDKIFYPLVSLDVLAHEVSHGFTEQNSGLIYSDTPSGGINESFSDIAGEAAKFYMHKDKPEAERNDWMLAGNVFKGGNDKALRYFDDPKKDGESIDNAKDFTLFMDPHYSSGVFNKAFYNLATTPNWNVAKAFKPFVVANQVYWKSNTGFDDAACGVFKAAKDLEQNTDDVIAAFKKVGVNAECKNNKEKDNKDNNKEETQEQA